MKVTEVRVRLVRNKGDRLKAYCSMTFDNEFVIRDIKVIEGTDGYFVAMPSRKVTDHCKKCRAKNHLKARFCNNCGNSLAENRIRKGPKGKIKLHADIAHPINTQCRRRIQERVVLAFREEVEKSKQPGYQPVDMEDLDDDAPEVTL
jgi:stage V sporulation protein G